VPAVLFFLNSFPFPVVILGGYDVVFHPAASRCQREFTPLLSRFRTFVSLAFLFLSSFFILFDSLSFNLLCYFIFLPQSPNPFSLPFALTGNSAPRDHVPFNSSFAFFFQVNRFPQPGPSQGLIFESKGFAVFENV